MCSASRDNDVESLTHTRAVSRAFSAVMVKIKGLSQQCLLSNVHNRFISSLDE